MQEIKLTEYSHGAGCGCKIAPSTLDLILNKAGDKKNYPNLLVGYDNKDDAAAYDLGNGTSILSTTDFFMPIVDDPFTFGKIAATNAISDIYAMGGTPLMAISILGWPINLLDPEIAGRVIEGGRSICDEAGIPLAGGHSIDSPEPIFGLAVTGIVDNNRLKQNNQAIPGCAIFITKPLGIGILTTAQKRKKIEPGHIEPAIEAMTTLNKIGAEISGLDSVVGLTDITGFGLLGHLGEVCKASGISAIVEFDKIPLLPHTKKYLAMDCVPGGTRNNFLSYGDTIEGLTEEQRDILCDAQTSGGLLVIVKKEGIPEFLEITAAAGLSLKPIGETCEAFGKFIKVV
ncbi:MAG: selenide, water dikinase SelD [Peptostreptococcales bacterium]